MRVIVRFTDGEVVEGQSDHASLDKMGFPVMFAEGNNQVAWVSLASIKYVLFPDTALEKTPSDPRDQLGLTKVVLHFLDGELMRSYRDDSFVQEGEGFLMRIWNEDAGGLARVLVSLHALKAVFFVNDWDSRTEEEKQRYAGTTPAAQGAP